MNEGCQYSLVHWWVVTVYIAFLFRERKPIWLPEAYEMKTSLNKYTVKWLPDRFSEVVSWYRPHGDLIRRRRGIFNRYFHLFLYCKQAWYEAAALSRSAVVLMRQSVSQGGRRLHAVTSPAIITDILTTRVEVKRPNTGLGATLLLDLGRSRRKKLHSLGPREKSSCLTESFLIWVKLPLLTLKYYILLELLSLFKTL